MSVDSLPVLIIPALNPDKKLIELLSEHQQLGLEQICIIINDGSQAASDPIFQELEAQGYTVLQHTKNLGKGAALKTGMKYYLEHYANLSAGIITADADGQHSIEDIVKLSQAFMQQPHQLHLGVREIGDKKVPLRSRVGNVLTKFIFNLVTRNKVRDTQTGLRAIPMALVEHLVATKTVRYEFEFEMFFIARTHGFKIHQTPIKTIYIDNNKDSHFNPLWDSLRIYFILLRFCSVALISFVLDFSLFSLFYAFGHHSTVAFLAARAISAPTNFVLNKQFSFKSKRTLLISGLQYFVLVLVMGSCSLETMNVINKFGVNIFCSKIMAEFLIFLANFLIQYWVIFPQKKPYNPLTSQ